MRVTRFHPTDDGGSVFSDLEVAFPQSFNDDEGHVLHLSGRVASPSVQFVTLPEGLDQGWHPAPRRQLVVVLSGLLEVTTTDGATRRFGAGRAFLADDVGSRGHQTRTVDGPVTVLFVPVPPDADLAGWFSES